MANRYNNGEPAKFADLYTQDAFSVACLGTLESKPEIEKGLPTNSKRPPKINVHPIAAQQMGMMVWPCEFVFDDDEW